MSAELWSDDYGAQTRRKPQPRPWLDLGEEAEAELHVVDLARTEAAIRTASAETNALASAQKIDAIWTRVENVVSLAESRMRIVLKRLAPPPVAGEPAWLAESLKLLDVGAVNERAHPSALESTKRLMLAVLAAAPAARATFEVAPGGSVSVVWDAPQTLRWTIGAARLPWPGVNCRLYFQNGLRAHNVDASSLHLAHAVLEATLPRLQQ